MTVAIYARVSTTGQNPDPQLTVLREYAQARQFTVFREYVDEATGAVEKRKRKTAYDQLLVDAHALKFRCVLVWKFDRFARSLAALLQALKTFESLGIDFISTTQAIDTTTPMGRFFFSVVGAFAEFEREMIVERIAVGIKNAKDKGVVFGRPRDLDVEEQIRRLKRDGLGVRAIARRVQRSPAGVLKILGRAE